MCMMWLGRWHPALSLIYKYWLITDMRLAYIVLKVSGLNGEFSAFGILETVGRDVGSRCVPSSSSCCNGRSDVCKALTNSSLARSSRTQTLFSKLSVTAPAHPSNRLSTTRPLWSNTYHCFPAGGSSPALSFAGLKAAPTVAMSFPVSAVASVTSVVGFSPNALMASRFVNTSAEVSSLSSGKPSCNAALVQLSGFALLGSSCTQMEGGFKAAFTTAGAASTASSTSSDERRSSNTLKVSGLAMG
mmetsp:Transcript_55368/g.92127  ORF Transcript_55368/g.92127 Transcript_55368/m.92127 type:complete len:245 (+) Transcript_55368:168-902(+)